MDVGVIVTGNRRGAMMVSAKRTIHDESKRCDDRQSGRKRPDQRMDGLYHQAPIYVAFTTTLNRWPLVRPGGTGLEGADPCIFTIFGKILNSGYSN